LIKEKKQLRVYFVENKKGRVDRKKSFSVDFIFLHNFLTTVNTKEEKICLSMFVNHHLSFEVNIPH